MRNAVQVFRGSINGIQDMINGWAYHNQVTILNTSLSYDQAGGFGHVFVIVVYELKSQSQTDLPPANQTQTTP